MNLINRDSNLSRLKNDGPFDLLIVGGGATGLGAAVDAAQRGYRVALVEKFDFAKGTSSRSTKLVHGGVRYLKQGDIKLVREALRERGRMARNAPHLVGNMQFVIPCYTRIDKAFYGVGMKVYDLLAGSLGLGAAMVLSKDETIRHLPTVNTKGLQGGVLYHDGQFDDARMAINLMQTAVEQGAVVVNYCECVRMVSDAAGIVKGASLVDRETGEAFTVEAKVVINATGVFVDELRKQQDPKSEGMVAVSQGIHVVLPKEFLPGNSALMVPKTADGRVLFAVPWHGCVVVGTTDTPVAGASVEPRALAEEYDFVMSHAAKYLAKAPKDSDVLSVFAGLRPLVKAGTSGTTASLSRDHTIAIDRGGMITITGGKWTTYRHMAEDVVDTAEKAGGFDHRPSGTAELPIHGGKDCQHPGGGALLPETVPTDAEVRGFVKDEMARTVEDVLARRTRLLLTDARESIAAAPAVAKVLAEELGRDEAWIEEQVQSYTALASGYLPGEVEMPALRAASLRN